MTQLDRSEALSKSEKVPDEARSFSLNEQRSRRQRRKAPTGLSNDSKTITTKIAAEITPLMSNPLRLLVCSIGNPEPLHNTLHSAGHIVLAKLASTLSYPTFQGVKGYAKGRVSSGSEYTLWKSTSFMNVSGPGVASAWSQFQRDARGEDAKLVVIHDELELGLGQVQVKKGNLSARGHNGLKSINEVGRGTDYTRIGIGIGRPQSRDYDDVVNHVMRTIRPEERYKLESCVGRVEEELRRLSGR